MRLRSAMPILYVLTAVAACNKSQTAAQTEFNSLPVINTVKPTINETSGMADSKKNKGYLWVQEDSGNPEQLYLLGHNGQVAKTMTLQNSTNRDWEEMQLSGTTIYLADIGDNLQQYNDYAIYTFAEPELATENISGIEKIKFVYADGPHDAEAFLVDAATKDIYIITKSDEPAKIYQLKYPYSFNSTNTAQAVGSLTYSDVVAAALSPDGSEIIIKTYAALQHYPRHSGQTIVQALQNPFNKLPYQIEPQGEAVTFAADNSGFYTLSEKGTSSAVYLYFYKRN